MATTNYERGRAFEYRVRDKLLKDGAVYVMRAAGSHTKADLAAFWDIPEPYRSRGWGEHRPKPWLVQCKRDGRLPAAEREELVSIARQTGTVPVLAKAGPKGRGVIFIDLESEEPLG